MPERFSDIKKVPDTDLSGPDPNTKYRYLNYPAAVGK
jgi:hypothetical protein